MIEIGYILKQCIEIKGKSIIQESLTDLNRLVLMIQVHKSWFMYPLLNREYFERNSNE